MALYCSQKLPAFLKEIEAYKRGDYEQALKDAFVSFDATLVNDDVIEELKKLIPEDKVDETDTDEEADEDEENLNELCNEGRMPLNELLEKLKDPLAKVKQGESSGTSKPLSPFLRGRRNGSSSGLGGSGSSSSSGAGGSSAPAASENGECSSASDSTIKPKKLDVSTILLVCVEMMRFSYAPLFFSFLFISSVFRGRSCFKFKCIVGQEGRSDQQVKKHLSCPKEAENKLRFLSISVQQMAHRVVEMEMETGTVTEMDLQAAKGPLAQNQMNGIHATVQTVHRMQTNQLVR